MSTHQKLSPKNTPMTNLKRLWRDDLAEDDRDYWREQFESSRSQASLRQEIEEKHGITLRHDSQLKRFRNWVAERDALEAVEERTAEDLVELEQQGLTPAQLRDELLCRMKARALINGDFNLALKAIAADVKVETLQLAREKFEAAYRTKVEAGLRCLSQEIRGNPAADAAFEAFCAIVEPDNDANPKPVESPEPNRPAAPTCRVEVTRRRECSEDGSAGYNAKPRFGPGSLDTAAPTPSPLVASTCLVEVGRRREPGEDGTQSDPIQPSPEPSRNVGAPASGTARPTCSPNPAAPIGPISPMRPIPPNPTESDLIKPTLSPVGRVPSRGNPPTNPSIQPSINPPAATETLDPYDEAYNRWFRMNCGAEPFDAEELQRLYDTIPLEEI